MYQMLSVTPLTSLGSMISFWPVLFDKAFWILGLLNNFLYVTMNAGAEDINEVAGGF